MAIGLAVFCVYIVVGNYRQDTLFSFMVRRKTLNKYLVRISGKNEQIRSLQGQLKESKKHIARLRDEVNRKVTDLMWHENVLRAIERKLYLRDLDGTGVGMTHTQFLEAIPDAVECPEPGCRHKGAEWFAREANDPRAIGIQCPECLSLLRAPFWHILKLEDIKPETPMMKELNMMKELKAEDFSDFDY